MKEARDLIESISVKPHFQRRHRSAPLLKEREQYLTHLLQIGCKAANVRAIAGYLINVVKTMGLTSLRMVEPAEIEEAGERWLNGPDRINTRPISTPRLFTTNARQWFRFHGALAVPSAPAGRFDSQLSDFKKTLESRGLAAITIYVYVGRIRDFLEWISERHNDLSLVALNDVDDYLDSKCEAGLRPTTIAGQSISLHAFFKVAEDRGWCLPGIWRGIQRPKHPTYTEVRIGPSWVDVRRLIGSVKGFTPVKLRARALFLVFSIYGLRASEVAGLRLDDFDWRNETFCVHRAKRGGIQHFPIQYEVGQAILDYLRSGRPRCACRNVFVTTHRPYRALSRSVMGFLVRKQMKRLGIQSEHCGPHSLRHACATRLLKKGSSLKEIADFLGHRNTKSVAIYAKFDKRSLRNVAAFSLVEVL